MGGNGLKPYFMYFHFFDYNIQEIEVFKSDDPNAIISEAIRMATTYILNYDIGYCLPHTISFILKIKDVEAQTIFNEHLEIVIRTITEK